MASLTEEQARLEMLTMLETAWNAGPINPVPKMFYDHNSQAEADHRAKSNETWARVVIDPSGRGDASLGGNHFRSFGLLKVQIFVPAGTGMTDLSALRKVVTDAFEGKHSPGGIWFRNVHPRNGQNDEPKWFMGLVFVEYEFDQHKT